MRKQRFLLLVSVFCLVFAGCGSKKQKEPAESWPAGWLVVDDDVWLPILNDLGSSLYAARSAYLNKDYKTASKEIWAGAQYLKLKIQPIAGRAKLEVEQAISQLEQLAKAIDQNDLRSIKELDEVFSKVYKVDLKHRQAAVRDGYWAPYTEEPDAHFNRAYNKFVNKDFRTAAIELRKSAGYLKMQSVGTSGDIRSSLDALNKLLLRLANDVESGVASSSVRIDTTIVRAHLALAQFHQQQAIDSFKAKRLQNTAYQLHAAAFHLERAVYWSDYKLDLIDEELFKNAQQLAGELAESGGYNANFASKTIVGLGEEIAKFNKTNSPLFFTSKNSTQHSLGKD